MKFASKIVFFFQFFTASAVSCRPSLSEFGNCALGGHFAGYDAPFSITSKKLCCVSRAFSNVTPTKRSFVRVLHMQQQRQKFQIWKGRYLRNVGKYSLSLSLSNGRPRPLARRRAGLQEEARLEGRSARPTDRLRESCPWAKV